MKMRNNTTTATVLDNAQRLQQLWHDAVENGEPCYLSLEFRDGKFRFHMNNAPRPPYRQNNGQHHSTGKSSTPTRFGTPPSSRPSAQPELIPAAGHTSLLSSPESTAAPPNGAPMQLRSTSRKKRKANASPETARNNKVNQELEVSSHQVSDRDLEDDLEDESEADVDSEENDACSACSQNDRDEGKREEDIRELTIDSDHFTPNSFALLAEVSESPTPPGTRSGINLPANNKPVIVTNTDSPNSNSASPAKSKCVKCCQLKCGSRIYDLCHDDSLEYVRANGSNPMIYCGVCACNHFFSDYCYKIHATVGKK